MESGASSGPGLAIARRSIRPCRSSPSPRTTSTPPASPSRPICRPPGSTHELARRLTLGPAAPPATSPPASPARASDIVVRGRVRAALTRPLRPLHRSLRARRRHRLTLLLQPAPPPARPRQAQAPPAKPDEEYEFTSDEADVDTYDGETVVLDPSCARPSCSRCRTFPCAPRAVRVSVPPPEPAPASGRAAARPPARAPRRPPRQAPVGAASAAPAIGAAPRPKTKKNKE